MMGLRLWRSSITALVLFAWLVGGIGSRQDSSSGWSLKLEPRTVLGQFEVRMQSDEIFLLAPRSLQRLLSEGKSAIRDGRYSEGIASLGAILYEDGDLISEDLRGQDFFMFRPSRGNYTQSLKSQAIQELNNLPEEGRRVLELQYGVTARKQLDDALSKRDFVAIEEVARRFAHCEAGYDALILVAQAKLSEGYPLVAADILQSLLDYPGARQRFGVRLAYSAALAWYQAGKPERASGTLKLAGRDFAGQSLTIQGQQIPIENWEGILAASQAPLDDRWTDKSVDNWLTAGGSASRNATSRIGMPLPNERWEWLIHSSRPEGMALLDTEESLRKSNNILVPRLELRMLDNTVISRSNDSSLVGIDFDSGLLIWRRSSSSGAAPLKRMAWDSTDKMLSKELLSRVWGSTAFGRFTCDSQRCYHVIHSQEEAEMVRGGGESFSRLEGISIARQGAILWSIGGSDGDEPELSAAYFLGPPLPYGGQLYSLIEINGEVELVVLDPESGKLRWRQQIATAPLSPVKSDKFRQAQGLTPSISDGVIVCPTGIGGVVAIDLLTRSFRWGAVYQLVGYGRAGVNFPGGVFGAIEYEPLQSRWLDECLIVDQGVVVITPPESDSLFCHDLLTGDLLYSRKRGNSCYVAGIDQTNLVVVNPGSVQAVDMLSKRNIWQVDFPDELSLAGKGVWQDGGLLLPLTNKRLIQVDVESGQLVNQANVAQPLGNLFAHKGQLLSVGPTSITSYHTRGELEQRVNQRLASDPRDTWGLNHRSQLLVSEGKYQEALELLLVSYESNPDDDDTRFFLADTMMTGLQNDFQRFAEYSDRLDDIIKATPQLWLQYLQLLAQGKIQYGDYLSAFMRLWEIMRERHSANIAGAMFRASNVQVADGHAVDLDHWLTVELGRCFEKCSAQEKSQIGQMVQAELQKVQGTILPVRRQLLQYLNQLPDADPENLMLAEALLDRGEQLGAEQLLQWLTMSQNAATRQAAAELLQREHPFDKNLAREHSAETNGLAWPKGLISTQVAEEAIYPVGRPVDVVNQRFGRPPITIAVSDRSLALSDADGKPVGNLAFRSATSELMGTYMRAETFGGLILAETVSELIAFDFYRGVNGDAGLSILWRYPFDVISTQETFQPAHILISTDELLGIQTQRRKTDGRRYAALGPMLTGVKIVQTGSTVVGIDAYSGRRLWSREGYSDQVRFCGNPETNTLAIMNPGEGVNQLIDPRDGKLLSTSQFLVSEIQARVQDQSLSKWSSWFSFDRWLIDYRADDSSNKVLFRIWSPFEERVLFEASLSKSARVGKTDDGLLTAVDPAGQFYLVNLAKGSVYQQDVPVDRELSGVSILRFADYAVVACNRSGITQQINQGVSEVVANGYVYAFDLKNERMHWSLPGRMINVSIPILQPRNGPYMAAYHISLGSKNPSASLVLIDLRNGRIASLVDGLSANKSSGFTMRLRPDQHEVVVALGEKTYNFQITDLPRPPEPVVHYGYTQRRNQVIIRDESSLFK